MGDKTNGIKELMNSQLLQECKDLEKFLRENNNYYIVTHNDVDGICSSYFLFQLLRKLGKTFEIKRIGMLNETNIDYIKKKSQGKKAFIFCDIGSSFLNACRNISSCRPLAIIDHHEIIGGKGHELHLNPLLFGEEGMQNCCGTVLAYLLLCFIFPTYWGKDLGLLFAGLMGDKQDIAPSFTNKRIIETLLLEGRIRKRKFFHLNSSLANFFAESFYPFYPLIQDRKMLMKIMKKTGINQNVLLSSLGEEESKRLEEELQYHHNQMPSFTQKILKGDKYGCSSGGGDFQDYLLLLQALQNGPDRDVDYGDMNPYSKKNALRTRKFLQGMKNRISTFIASFKEKIIGKTAFILNQVQGVAAILSETYFYFLNPGVESIFLVQKVGIHFKVSSRTSLDFVKKGVNLALIMEKLAQETGGVGGGHKVAAGGKFPIKSFKILVEKIEKIFQKEFPEAIS